METLPTARTLEVTVLSGEDLRLDRKSVKKNAYVIVRTDPFNYRMTKIDEQGGSYPSWNDKLVIDLPQHASFITLEVQCKSSSSSSSSSSSFSSSSGDRFVGTANVPVSDFIGGYVPENYLHCLSYRLRDGRGDKNGIINILVRVKVPAANYYSEKVDRNGAMMRINKVTGYPSCSSTTSRPQFGLPVAGTVVGRNYGGDVVVTGVPVWCGYQRA